MKKKESLTGIRKSKYNIEILRIYSISYLRNLSVLVFKQQVAYRPVKPVSN